MKKIYELVSEYQGEIFAFLLAYAISATFGIFGAPVFGFVLGVIITLAKSACDKFLMKEKFDLWELCSGLGASFIALLLGMIGRI